MTRSGRACRRTASPGSDYCSAHQDQADLFLEEPPEREERLNFEGEDEPDHKQRWPGWGMDPEEYGRVAELHRQWKQSKGKSGQRADFREVRFFITTFNSFWWPGADFRGSQWMSCGLRRAVLSDADMRGAYMNDCDFRDASISKADMRGIYLRDAILSGAYLVDSDLRGAHMEDAVLESEDKTEAELEQELDQFIEMVDGDEERIADYTPAKRREPANLARAKLRDTDLTGARMSDVKGLTSDSLAGTNLTRAKLPPEIAAFELLDYVAEISKTARGTFLAMIGACFYCWLAIATTSLEPGKGEATVNLPIIDTPVPVLGFFLIAPLIIFSIYIYLHMYLIRLWSGLGTLPAFFPDSRSLDEKVYPWPLTSMVRLFVPLLKERRPPLWWLQVAMSVLLAWLLVPITELAFLTRLWSAEKRLSLTITGLNLLGSLVVMVATFDIARTALSGNEAPPIFRRLAVRLGWRRRPKDDTEPDDAD
jgi:uncharacterized protein YjbI with pentapeptide repeats